MIPHWTELRGELQQWLTTQPRILLGCDFDGTVSGIVGHASEAKMSDVARSALDRLSAMPGVMVAFVSGRSLADLRQRVGLRRALYAGNHGLEMLGEEGALMLAPGTEKGQGRLQQILGPLEQMLRRVPGVWLENKHWTASVHYRLASVEHHALVGQIVKTSLENAPELVLKKGKLVWEIRPAVDWHKGAALRCLMEHHKVPSVAVAFLGDDVTDMDAFEVVPDGWPCVVGSEVAGGRVKLTDPDDVGQFLEWMARERLSGF